MDPPRAGCFDDPSIDVDAAEVRHVGCTRCAAASLGDQFDLLAVAINTGTNIPSVATPNGQAAFLFLLTSALAPLIRLSYGRMVILALPYTITMTLTGLLAIIFFV